MRTLIVIALVLLSTKSFSGDLSGTLNGSISINLLLGTQLKAVNFGISIFGTGTYKSTSVEGGINLNLSPFIQRYGVYKGNFSGSFEMFWLVGYGKNYNLLGSNIGMTKHTAFYDSSIKDGSFYGVGMVAVINKITGDLKKFENKQGGFLMRFSHKQTSVAFNMINDVNARPFSKSGTDKGNTARAMLSYTTIRADELFGFGIGLDMFTPEADYGKAPRGIKNSEDGMRAVLINTKPYDNLFHLNLFSSFVYQTKDFNIDGRLGVDNYKLGAFVQNVIHDNFALYPRFSWPVEKKGKFYSLIDASIPFTNNFNN